MRQCDIAVVGSGFGGAVSALRLADQGLDVEVLEQGRRQAPTDLLTARRDPRRYLWQPELGLRGFFWQRMFADVGIIGGAGVGGGSIVWGAVLLEPGAAFFTDPAWAHLSQDWEEELRPHYEMAACMLGRTPNRVLGEMDEHLRDAAVAMGAEESFGPVPLGIYFGDAPGSRTADPFFGGEGPLRTGCRLCGGCLVGCPYGAKNTLDLNYLHLAERRGAQIRPEHRVVGLKPLRAGGYELAIAGRPPLRAHRVVLAAGVLGTLELLFRCRDELGTLPNVSPMLGRRVRTNSEAVTAVLADDPDADLTRGPSISSDFHADPHAHVTQNRYVGGWHMRFQLGPLVDGDDPRRRARATLAAIGRHPVRQARVLFARGFERRLSALTVMQHVDNELRFVFGRSPLRPWRRVLRSRRVQGNHAPSYLPVANEVTRAFADSIGGQPLNLLAESVGGRSVTAHILGGAVMGASAEEGVVDVNHEVFGHPGLYVADAAAIPANLGVNPSLTITAMAERFSSRLNQRPGSEDEDPIAASPTGDLPSVRPDSVPALVHLFSRLPVSPLEALAGTHEAHFVGPRALRAVAVRGIGLAGLPRWYGKRFEPAAEGELSGVNLLRLRAGGSDFKQVLPMRAKLETSWADGFTAIAVSYGPGERLPWSRVRDEFRPLDERTLLGLSFLDLPGARGFGLPFLLRRCEAPSD